VRCWSYRPLEGRQMTDYSIKFRCHAMTRSKARCVRRGRIRYGTRWVCSQHWLQFEKAFESNDLIGEGLILWNWGDYAQQIMV
jgi:hypothetical protein